MKEWKILVRPLKPEWFQGEDLDSLTRIITFCSSITRENNDAALIHYLRGWIDAGYIIMGIDEVEE